MTQFKLISEILKRSQADIWDYARLEWKLHSIEFGDGDDECLCGKQHIVELCYIQNHHSQETVLVGNSCVNKFLELSSKQLFDAIKRIRKDIEKAPNSKLISYAFEKGWIDSWEKNFSLDTHRKRKLSVSQLNKRRGINRKILRRLDTG